MAIFKVLLSSLMPCVITHNGEHLTSLEQNFGAHILEIDNENAHVFSVFPIIDKQQQKKLLPYTFKLAFEGASIKSNCPHAKVIHYPNNCLEIELLPFELHEFDIPKTLCKQQLRSPLGDVWAVLIKDSKYRFLISSHDDNLLLHTLDFEIENPQITQKKLGDTNFVFLEGNVDNMSYLLAVSAHSTFEANVEILCHKIEFLENSIKTLTKCLDMARHGKVQVFGIHENLLQKTDEYLVQLSENIKIFSQAPLVPFAFFESLQVGDLKLARSYLSVELNDSISDAHLSSYFGNFIRVENNKFDDSYNTIALIYEKDTSAFAKLYKIQFDGNLIDNFVEL